MANRAPQTSWSLRRAPECGYVRTTDDDDIQIVLPEFPDSSRLTAVELSRKDARLLAKRLNQCLDETAFGGGR